MSEKFWTGVTVGAFGFGMWCLGFATGYWASKSEHEAYKAKIAAGLLDLSTTTFNGILSRKQNEEDEETKEQEEA